MAGRATLTTVTSSCTRNIPAHMVSRSMPPVDRGNASVAVEVCRGHPGGMEGDADIARTAALFADPARVRVLLALADGRALAASVLAGEARLSAQGVSA